jgi:hypothetical protein
MLPATRNVWGMGCAGCVRKLLHKRNTWSKHVFALVLAWGVFLGDIADRWVKDFRCIYRNTITNSISFYCNDASLREDDM